MDQHIVFGSGVLFDVVFAGLERDEETDRPFVSEAANRNHVVLRVSRNAADRPIAGDVDLALVQPGACVEIPVVDSPTR